MHHEWLFLFGRMTGKEVVEHQITATFSASTGAKLPTMGKSTNQFGSMPLALDLWYLDGQESWAVNHVTSARMEWPEELRDIEPQPERLRVKRAHSTLNQRVNVCSFVLEWPPDT
jgi:hypothetical protein